MNPDAFTCDRIVNNIEIKFVCNVENGGKHISTNRALAALDDTMKVSVLLEFAYYFPTCVYVNVLYVYLVERISRWIMGKTLKPASLSRRGNSARVPLQLFSLALSSLLSRTWSIKLIFTAYSSRAVYVHIDALVQAESSS